MNEASWMDHLAPEALRLLGLTAWGTLALGIILWALGLLIARGAVAAILGSLGALAGGWLVNVTGAALSPLTGALIGFVLGSVAGAVGFRFVQGVVLAACLGTAVAGVYYVWHVAPRVGTGVHGTTLPLVALKRLPENQPGTRKTELNLQQTAEQMRQQLAAIPLRELQWMGVVAVGAAAVAMLVAMKAPRGTTALITATVGAVIIMAATRTLLALHWRTLLAHWPGHAGGRYLVWGVLAALGIAIQCRFFLRRPDKAPQTPASQDATGKA